MSICAIWRRLDLPGHDAALLTREGEGWSLRGSAVFHHDAGPACIAYAVDLDAGWRTRRGEVNGFLAGRRLQHVISRDADGWRLDGVPQPGLEDLWDLDYGFTPATNLQQLRRADPADGTATDLPVAWFDLEAQCLAALPQRYERRGPHAFWYEAPTVPYRGLLELASNGFVRTYPGLWQLED